MRHPLFDATDGIKHDDESCSSIENIQAELTSLSVWHAQVQKRIHHIRHALVELVHVFGPEILLTSRKDSEIVCQPLSRSGVKMIDLVRGALSHSRRWLTLCELVELIRQESQANLARFMNPGVAVSNALRVLERRGEVEIFQDAQTTRWRFVEIIKPALLEASTPTRYYPRTE
jgi:hypothetical protein